LLAKHYNFLNTPHRGVEEVINQHRINFDLLQNRRDLKRLQGYATKRGYSTLDVDYDNLTITGEFTSFAE
jgi:hypothetical protein